MASNAATSQRTSMQQLLPRRSPQLTAQQALCKNDSAFPPSPGPRRVPPMLTPEELAKLSPAEELFPSPIPVQFVSSDEYMPAPQTPQQKEFEERIKESGTRLAKRLGISRRRFFKTAG